MGKQGHSTVAAAWRESGLSWGEFLPAATEVRQFVADNKLEWLEEVGAAKEGARSKEGIKTPEMIRVLTTAVAESVIDGIGGPTAHCQLNEEKLNQRSQILKLYVDASSRLELQVLLALQHLMHRLEHPNKLLHSIFE